MAGPRLDHTATWLSDGRVLIVGGRSQCANSPCPPLSTAELYDPKTGTFSQTGSMGTARLGHTATLLSDGRVLIVGGSTGTSLLSSGELYDPATGTFRPTGTMRTARTNHAATLLSGGRVLIVGGGAGTRDHPYVLASAELYDPATGTFSPTGPMTTARILHTATRLSDGRVLIAGGMSGVSSSQPILASAELYDTATGTFVPTGSMATARFIDTATLLSDGRVLIAGGNNGLADGWLPSAELWDPKIGKFSKTGEMVNPTQGHTATLLPDDRVLIAGGGNGSSSLSFGEMYDPATGEFGWAGLVINARGNHTATLLSDGRVLIVGGVDHNGEVLASAEIYQP